MYEFRCKSTASKGLDRKVMKVFEDAVRKRIQDTASQMRDKISKYITRVLKANIIYQAIGGAYAGEKGGTDLQAEFGLTNDMAALAQTLMLEIIPNANIIKYRVADHGSTTRRIASFRIQVLVPSLYKDRLTAGEPFVYTSTVAIRNKKAYNAHQRKLRAKANMRIERDISAENLERVRAQKPRVYTINWMQWLMSGRNANAAMRRSLDSIQAYGIKYDLNGRTKWASRSGRALMIPGETAGFKAQAVSEMYERGDAGGRKMSQMLRSKKHRARVSAYAGGNLTRFPYSISSLVLPKEGRNFIDEISLNKNFRLHVRDNIIKKTIMKMFDTKTVTPIEDE